MIASISQQPHHAYDQKKANFVASHQVKVQVGFNMQAYMLLRQWYGTGAGTVLLIGAWRSDFQNFRINN
jgi:hypothetical protein